MERKGHQGLLRPRKGKVSPSSHTQLAFNNLGLTPKLRIRRRRNAQIRKPNTRFLSAVIRTVDDHNAALRRADEQAARERDREERHAAERWRRQQQHERSRSSAARYSSRHERDRDEESEDERRRSRRRQRRREELGLSGDDEEESRDRLHRQERHASGSSSSRDARSHPVAQEQRCRHSRSPSPPRRVAPPSPSSSRTQADSRGTTLHRHRSRELSPDRNRPADKRYEERHRDISPRLGWDSRSRSGREREPERRHDDLATAAAEGNGYSRAVKGKERASGDLLERDDEIEERHASSSRASKR